MKIIVLRNNLKNGVDSLGGVGIKSLTTLLVLKNFLIETENNKIKLSATNLELAITYILSGKIIEDGAVTVPINIFSSILNNLLSERVDLESDEENITLKTDNYEAKIHGIKKEEFPIIPEIADKRLYLEISPDILRESLIFVSGATQVSDSRPEFGGILFEFQPTILKIAATDGVRLAEKTLTDQQFKSQIENRFKIIIPFKTTIEIIRILKSEDGLVKIFFDPNQVLIKNDKVEITSRLVNAEFPEYQQIIPHGTETEVIINRADLVSALKLAGSFSDRLLEIKLTIGDKSKNIEVFSSAQGLGENRYLLPAKIKGKPMEIIFNWRYLLDGVKNFSSEEIILGFRSGDKPTVIKAPQDISAFYILMPVKAL